MFWYSRLQLTVISCCLHDLKYKVVLLSNKCKKYQTFVLSQKMKSTTFILFFSCYCFLFIKTKNHSTLLLNWPLAFNGNLQQTIS